MYLKHAFSALFLVAVAGCGLVNNPLAVAETPDQKVYAILATYNVVLESAADIVEDESLPLDLRVTVQEVEAQTTPVIDGLDAAYAEFVLERAKFNADMTTAERLSVVAANLEGWVARAEAALLRLSELTEGS